MHSSGAGLPAKPPPINVLWVDPPASLPPKPPPPLSCSTSSHPPLARDSKRKAEDPEDVPTEGSEKTQRGIEHDAGMQSNVLVLPTRKTFTPTIVDRASSDPIPILPTPLPSKRFRKNPLRKATLLPIDQIPTFPLPPLPAIDDPILLKQVFTHQSLFEKVKGKFEDKEDDPAKHYEKLEHVGDSLLGMVVTTWLHEIKPGLTPGTATRLKAHLVSNATLSHLSGLYGLPQRLNADPNLLPLLRVSTDVRAALLEAYIAGVYVSFPVSERNTKALGIITEWLREMYDPLYDFFYTFMKNEHEQHQNAVGTDLEGNVIVMDQAEMARVDEQARGMLLLLKMHVKAYEGELRFEEQRHETGIGTLFQMKCLVDGMELGEATRAGRNQAREVAAWEAAKKLGLAVG